MTSQCYVFEFTLAADGITWMDVLKDTGNLCKKILFQLERGEESGYLHYQGKLSLHKKTRYAHKLFAGTCLEKGSFSPTVKENVDKWETSYVTKEQTKIDGPWTFDDKPAYIPIQYRIENLRPFQQTILDKTTELNFREINIVYCRNGCVGKSTLCGYLSCRKLARKLPTVNDYKELMQIAYAVPTSRCYIFDMPRAIPKKNLQGLYSAIETIKDGHLYDARYVYKEKWIDSPNIWVFTNKLPDFSWMSSDRWKIWVVNDEYELVKYALEDRI